jgi:hypothetical protein
MGRLRARRGLAVQKFFELDFRNVILPGGIEQFVKSYV